MILFNIQQYLSAQARPIQALRDTIRSNMVGKDRLRFSPVHVLTIG